LILKNYVEGGDGTSPETVVNFHQMTLCSNSAESYSYINTLLLPFFIGLEFVSVCAMNGDVAFCINDG
jgi:hypothetical protein